MSAHPLRRRPARAPQGLVVRRCTAADRARLRELGHSPGAVRALAPTLVERLEWAGRGARIAGLVAQEGGRILGSVQFVGSRRDPGTWLFGHWRVAAGLRRAGVGRILLRDGLRLLPEIRRLYSYVDRGNGASMAAHARLGFEAAPEIRGSATLAALSRIGPASPPLGARRVRRRERPDLFPLYRRAVGPLWMRLFPGIDRRNYLRRGAGLPDGRGPLSGLLPGALVRVLALGPDGDAVGLVVQRGGRMIFFLDPGACCPGLLARAALRMIGMRVPRDGEVDLRGLSADLAARPGPIAARVLMGMPDAGRLRDAPP